MPRRAYRQAPFNPNVIDTLGWAEVQTGDAQEGRRAAARGVQSRAGERRDPAASGQGLIKTGDKAGAKKALEPLSKLDQASPARVEADKLLSGL